MSETEEGSAELRVEGGRAPAAAAFAAPSLQTVACVRGGGAPEGREQGPAGTGDTSRMVSPVPAPLVTGMGEEGTGGGGGVGAAGRGDSRKGLCRRRCCWFSGEADAARNGLVPPPAGVSGKLAGPSADRGGVATGGDGADTWKVEARASLVGRVAGGRGSWRAENRLVSELSVCLSPTPLVAPPVLSRGRASSPAATSLHSRQGDTNTQIRPGSEQHAGQARSEGQRLSRVNRSSGTTPNQHCGQIIGPCFDSMIHKGESWLLAPGLHTSGDLPARTLNPANLCPGGWCAGGHAMIIHRPYEPRVETYLRPQKQGCK